MPLFRVSKSGLVNGKDEANKTLGGKLEAEADLLARITGATHRMAACVTSQSARMPNHHQSYQRGACVVLSCLSRFGPHCVRRYFQQRSAGMEP